MMVFQTKTDSIESKEGTIMYDERSIRENPENIKHLTGLPSVVFFALLERCHEELLANDRERFQKPDRIRKSGGGRKNNLPLIIRVFAVLMYLRLHIPQRSVAALIKGVKQYTVSRELRRVLPLLKRFLPVPALWEVLEEGQASSQGNSISASQIPDDIVLIDAMEQQVYRPEDEHLQEVMYSGKKKQHTVKTQLVTSSQHKILAITEAVEGKRSDIQLSRDVKTLSLLPDDTEAIADKAYQSLEKEEDNKKTECPETFRVLVTTPIKKPKNGELTKDESRWNAEISKVRVRVEHCIGWVKNWKVIGTRFRCSPTIYSSALQVVCGFVNQQTEAWQRRKFGYSGVLY